MRFKKTFQYPGARRTGARHHHGNGTPTSARAVLHHTDQKGPNIMHPSVPSCGVNVTSEYRGLGKLGFLKVFIYSC